MKKIFVVLMFVACLGLSANFAQAETVERQTAEGPMKFETYGGGVAGAQNDWAKMTEAGFHYEPGRMALAWRFSFNAKVSDIAKVEVWDISSAAAQLLISQENIKLKNNSWHASTDLKDMTFQSEPWLMDKKTTERFYKIVLTNSKGETRTLYQMAMFHRDMKQQTVSLMKGNYIHIKAD